MIDGFKPHRCLNTAFKPKFRLEKTQRNCT